METAFWLLAKKKNTISYSAFWQLAQKQLPIAVYIFEFNIYSASIFLLEGGGVNPCFLSVWQNAQAKIKDWFLESWQNALAKIGSCFLATCQKAKYNLTFCLLTISPKAASNYSQYILIQHLFGLYLQVGISGKGLNPCFSSVWQNAQSKNMDRYLASWQKCIG